MRDRSGFVVGLLIFLALHGSAVAQNTPATQPTPAPKCASVPTKRFPPEAPAATTKQGRFAACMPPKNCQPGDAKGLEFLGASYCAMNYTDACRKAVCDKGGLTCQADLRTAETKGIKLSNCITRPSPIGCANAGEDICLCDMEIEAKGGLVCGCSCQTAPTPSPAPRK